MWSFLWFCQVDCARLMADLDCLQGRSRRRGEASLMAHFHNSTWTGRCCCCRSPADGTTTTTTTRLPGSILALLNGHQLLQIGRLLARRPLEWQANLVFVRWPSVRVQFTWNFRSFSFCCKPANQIHLPPLFSPSLWSSSRRRCCCCCVTQFTWIVSVTFDRPTAMLCVFCGAKIIDFCLSKPSRFQFSFNTLGLDPTGGTAMLWKSMKNETSSERGRWTLLVSWSCNRRLKAREWP